MPLHFVQLILRLGDYNVFIFKHTYFGFEVAYCCSYHRVLRILCMSVVCLTSKTREMVLTKKISVLLLVMALTTAFFWKYSVATSETGPIEWAQNLLLILALVAWVNVLVHQLMADEVGYHYVFAAFFSLLTYGVLGRELSWLEVLGARENVASAIEMVSILAALIVLATLLYIWIFRVNGRLNEMVKWFTSSSFVYAAFSLCFVLLGDLFDKKIIPVDQYRLFEEMSELTGYAFLLLAALCEWPFQSLRKKT